MSAWPSEPEILAFIERSNAIVPDALWEGPPSAQREGYRRYCAALRRPRPEGIEVWDRLLDRREGRLPLRFYRPKTAAETLPLLIYLHGGGWMVGDLESHDDICAELAERCRVAVLAVDYRLAPEHPYPAAQEDCLAALAWARGEAATLGIDPARILLAGDSAGGNLAAGTTLRLRDGAGPQVQGQVLIYPSLGEVRDGGSFAEMAEAPMLTTASMLVYRHHYSGGGRIAADSYMRPLTAANLSGLPPAYISGAYFDPLRDDASDYARRLREAGVPAELTIEPQMVHSYLRARHDSPGAAAAFASICAAVRRLAGADSA